MKSMVQLDIKYDILYEFVDGIQSYEFHIRSFPKDYFSKMTKKDFLYHLYGILQNFIETGTEEGEEISLCKIMVLYAVSSFKQKKETNMFLVSFLVELNALYSDSSEVEFVVELINAFSDDKALLKEKIRYNKLIIE